MIYETHTHFDDKAFDDDRDEAIRRTFDAGIGKIVNIGSSIKSSKTSLMLAREYPDIYAAIGVHPEETKDLTEDDMAVLEEYAKDDNVVAIGEIGLDYYWDEPERKIQKKWFIRQIDLAKKAGLPIVIHSRDAAEDTLNIVKDTQAETVGGIVHCFSYGTQVAKQYLDLGFYIGVGGVVTFKNAKKLKEVVEYVPLDRIVTETDSPYLAPVPMRGGRNSSEYLPYIVEAIATIKGVTAEEVESVTYENAVRIFGK